MQTPKEPTVITVQLTPRELNELNSKLGGSDLWQKFRKAVQAAEQARKLLQGNG